MLKWDEFRSRLPSSSSPPKRIFSDHPLPQYDLSAGSLRAPPRQMLDGSKFGSHFSSLEEIFGNGQPQHAREVPATQSLLPDVKTFRGADAQLISTSLEPQRHIHFTEVKPYSGDNTPFRQQSIGPVRRFEFTEVKPPGSIDTPYVEQNFEPERHYHNAETTPRRGTETPFIQQSTGHINTEPASPYQYTDVKPPSGAKPPFIHHGFKPEGHYHDAETKPHGFEGPASSFIHKNVELVHHNEFGDGRPPSGTKTTITQQSFQPPRNYHDTERKPHHGTDTSFNQHSLRPVSNHGYVQVSPPSGSETPYIPQGFEPTRHYHGTETKPHHGTVTSFNEHSFTPASHHGYTQVKPPSGAETPFIQQNFEPTRQGPQYHDREAKPHRGTETSFNQHHHSSERDRHHQKAEDNPRLIIEAPLIKQNDEPTHNSHGPDGHRKYSIEKQFIHDSLESVRRYPETVGKPYGGSGPPFTHQSYEPTRHYHNTDSKPHRGTETSFNREQSYQPIRHYQHGDMQRRPAGAGQFSEESAQSDASMMGSGGQRQHGEMKPPPFNDQSAGPMSSQTHDSAMGQDMEQGREGKEENSYYPPVLKPFEVHADYQEHRH